jgi:hypothetical protein
MKRDHLRIYRGPPLTDAQRRAVDRLVVAVARLTADQRARLDRHLRAGLPPPRPAS